MLADAAEIRQAMEYYEAQGWTDGLPVVPVTESYLAEFLAGTGRDPAEILLKMPHLNRELTVRLAAINAALAGCRPDYFPVVLAAWESLAREGYVRRAIWQSTTGTAPFLIVNGPVRQRIGLNSKGNVFGSGFRANATIGRAIRLGAINAFGLRPHELDQATQGTPAKYTACIAENEEESPWPPLHAEFGLDPSDSAVTAMVIRSCVHIEARHTMAPEQLAADICGTISRTGALVHPTLSAAVVLGPEHARLFSRAGWSKADLKRFLYDHAVLTRNELAAAGKDALSSRTRWRLPADHPDAIPGSAADGDIQALTSPDAVLVVVAGAGNAGVSAVVETFGPRGAPPPVTRVTLSRTNLGFPARNPQDVTRRIRLPCLPMADQSPPGELRRDPLPLRGRVALVTGASRRAGIGYAIARRLAALGASLFLHHFAPHDRDQPWGADPGGTQAVVDGVTGALAAGGARVHHIELDLAEPQAPGRLIESATEAFGHLDILVCNHARSGGDGPLGTLDAAMLDAHWAVNTRSVILLVQAFAAQHDGRPGGRIVLMTSGQDLGPMTGEVCYAASKGALASITRTLADHLAGRPITLNTVNPGPVDTGYATPEDHEIVRRHFPQGRWGTPDDPARLIAWLATDEAAWITGQIINTEGGFRRSS